MFYKHISCSHCMAHIFVILKLYIFYTWHMKTKNQDMFLLYNWKNVETWFVEFVQGQSGLNI